MEDELGEAVRRLMLPQCKRMKGLELAHDYTGHVGVRAMRKMLNTRFSWPGLGKDVCEYVQSCDRCL